MVKCTKKCNNVMLVFVKYFEKSSYEQELLIDYLKVSSGLKSNNYNTDTSLETVVYVKMNDTEIYGRIIAQVSLSEDDKKYIIKFTSKRIEKDSIIYINDKPKGYVINHLLQNTYECLLHN